MSLRHSCGIGFVALLLAIGCGDDDSESEKAAAGAAGTDAGGAAGGGGAGGTAGSQSGGSSGSAGSSGTSGAAGESGSAGAGGGSGAGGSSGGSAAGSVECGATSCALPATFCCALYNQPHVCMSPGETCFPGVDVYCDGPEDCPGQICCGELYIQGKNKSYVRTSCEASCTGTDRRELCGDSGTCTTGGTCGPSELLPQYRDCK
jgi:hypothetical protein